ncbi:Leucine Rich repeats (2 copies) [Crateriforma conspicua]|uniref:Leucine Rich repeats (2 copies) n=1 Tax=Crateriforma conspicua TaxID=2527996 RepID=A0A5C6FG91_9PLAN|nr:Leucine Rich repeats (2 copies) [Crateriforma conspicua]
MRISQFSIRALVVAIGFIAICLHFATRQQRIAAELRNADARIYYRYQYENWDDPERYSRNNRLELPSLIRFAGPDMVSTIVDVSLSGPEDPSRAAELCSKLPNLRLLAIQDCPLADSDLNQLAGLNDLRGLYLRGTSITDASVATLKELRHLRVLNVTETSLSEEALAELRQSLPNTKIHSGARIGSMM